MPIDILQLVLCMTTVMALFFAELAMTCMALTSKDAKS